MLSQSKGETPDPSHFLPQKDLGLHDPQFTVSFLSHLYPSELLRIPQNPSRSLLTLQGLPFLAMILMPPPLHSSGTSLGAGKPTAQPLLSPSTQCRPCPLSEMLCPSTAFPKGLHL